MSIWDRLRKGPGTEPEQPVPLAQEPPAFPYPLVAVPGRQAVEEWKRLRALWRPEGASPVLVGHREQVEQARGSAGKEVEEALRVAAGLSAEDFFLSTLRGYEAELGEEHDLWGTSGLPCPDGEWDPGSAAGHRFIAQDDILTRRPRPLVYLARIPTAKPWEIPAYLGYGGWNDCPEPAVQVAVLRRWHERYGAAPYAMAGDVVECWVERPPVDREGAEALAREQYFYCADIVDQGTKTLLALASSLKGSGAWYFWWD